MVVCIRLSMHGPRNNKFFRLVAINSRQRRDARPIETLGEYRPRVAPIKTVEWSVDRIKYWLGVGAIPSKSATRLLTQGGILPPTSRGLHPPHRPLTLQAEKSPVQNSSRAQS